MKSNKLIAEFMGIKYAENRNSHKSSDYYYEDIELEYHTSWDWLMPVVKRIVSDVELDIDYEDEYREHLMDVVPFAKIEDVYEAVVEFINKNQ